MMRKYLHDDLIRVFLFFFAFFTQISTVFNNAYQKGSTLFDSGIEQSILWRSGWLLTPARTIASQSYFEMHVSPILYLPTLLSYVMPISSMGYYGCVYGVVYGLLLLISFNLLKELYGSPWAALAGALAIYISGVVTEANWEPHHEIMSSVLSLAFFAAWFRGRKSLSLFLLLADCAVREDCGVLLALPLAALWLADHLDAKAERAPLFSQAFDAGSLALLALLCSVVAFAAKAQFPASLDTIDVFYYTKSAPFEHLSAGLILNRIAYLFGPGLYVILPGAMLGIGALLLRDWRVMIGWFAFLPYFLFNFFSKMEMAASFLSYKGFPYLLALLWPSLLYLGPLRTKKGLGLLQAAVLISGLVVVRGGQPGLMRSIPELADRWSLQTESFNRDSYLLFAPRLAEAVRAFPGLKGSQGSMALYPDIFDVWSRASVKEYTDAPESSTDTLLWFDGDLDHDAERLWLTKRSGLQHYRIIGTHLIWSTKSDEAHFSPLLPVLEKVTPDSLNMGLT